MSGTEQCSPQQFTIESDDRDEISSYFSERVSKVSVSPISYASGVKISASVIRCGHGVAFQTDIPTGARFRQAEDLDGIFVFAPTHGERAIWKNSIHEVVCSPNAGYVGPMNEHDTMECIGPWGHQAFKISRDQITRCLSQLLDEPVSGSLEFNPTIDLQSVPGRTLTAMLQLALTPVGNEPFLSASPLAAAQFSESLTLLLLEGFRHSYSKALSNRGPALQPKHVKRAIAYMRENAGSPLTLQEIAAAADVSVRAIHYGFQKFVGETPFEHLKKIRLEAAYADLMHEPETTSIADIAKRWGFPNPGRFAGQCKSAYGRSPSEIRAAKLRSSF